MANALNFHLVLLLMVFAHLPSSYTKGRLQLTGSSQPRLALVGDDIVLPCYVEPSTNASDMTVEWARLDLDPRFVYVWRDGVELESKKHPDFKGRTSMSIHKLKYGDISLNLSKVKRSDNGTYKCYIPNVGETFIRLVVGTLSLPVIVGVQKAKTGVVLECESAGWYPEPELLWLDGEGNLLSAGPTKTLSSSDGLYAVSSSVTVEKRHSNNITCRIQLKTINQSREAYFHISADFFTIPPRSDVCIGIILAVGFFLCIPVLIFAYMKWNHNKSRRRQTI